MNFKQKQGQLFSLVIMKNMFVEIITIFTQLMQLSFNYVLKPGNFFNQYSLDFSFQNLILIWVCILLLVF